MPRNGRFKSHHRRGAFFEAPIQSNIKSDASFDETTAAPTLGGAFSNESYEKLLALTKARALSDAKRKNLECLKAYDTVAALQRRLTEMEAELAEEHSRFLNLDRSWLAAIDRQAILQQAQSNTVAEQAQALQCLKEENVSLKQQLRLVEAEKQTQAAHQKSIQSDIEERCQASLARTNLQLQAKESQLQEVLAAQQETAYQCSQTIADLQQRLQESQSQFASLSQELDASRQRLEEKEILLRKKDEEQQELRTNHQMVLALFTKTLQDVFTIHALQITALRQEHKQAIHKQLPDLEKAKTSQAHVSADLEARVEREMKQNQALVVEKKKLQLHVQNLEAQLTEKEILFRRKDDEQQRLERLFEQERLKIQSHADDDPASVPSRIQESTLINSDKEAESCDAAKRTCSHFAGSDAESSEQRIESGPDSDLDYIIGVRKPRRKAISYSKDGSKLKSTATVSLTFSLNDESTPLLQLMDNHEKSLTSSVMRNCTEILQHEMPSCGDREDRRFQQHGWLLWLMWLFSAVVNFEVVQSATQFCGFSKNHWFEKPVVDMTPVEANQTLRRVFSSVCKISMAKPVGYLFSGKRKSRGFIFLFLLLMLQAESLYFPLTPGTCEC